MKTEYQLARIQLCPSWIRARYELELSDMYPQAILHILVKIYVGHSIVSFSTLSLQHG